MISRTPHHNDYEKNILDDGLFAYLDAPGVEGPQLNEAEKGVTEAEKKDQDKPKLPEEIQSEFNDAHLKLEAKYKATEGDISGAEQTALNHFNERIEAIRADYVAKIDAFKKEKHETLEKAAGEAIREPVNKLIAEIEKHTDEETIPDIKATEAEEVTEAEKPKAEEAPARPEAAPKAETIDKNNVPHAIAVLKKTFKLSTKEKNPLLDGVVNDLAESLSKEQYEAAKNEKPIKLQTEQLAILAKIVPEKFEKPTKKELEAMQALGKKEGFDKVSDLFDDAKDAAFIYIAQRNDILLGDGNIFINGKPVTSPNELTQFLPEKSRGNFEKAINGEGDALKELTKELNQHNEAAKALSRIKSIMENPEAAKKMGLMESLAALFQLWKAVQVAFEKKDWATLNDVLKDFKEKKNPAESMQESRKTYAEFLTNKTPNLKTSLELFLNPRNKEADSLFETADANKKEGLKRYRGELQPAIQDYLKGKIGMKSIKEINTLENGDIQIEGYNKKGRISVEIDIKKDGAPEARISNYTKKPNKEGEETYEKGKPSEAIPVDNYKTLSELINQ